MDGVIGGSAVAGWQGISGRAVYVSVARSMNRSQGAVAMPGSWPHSPAVHEGEVAPACRRRCRGRRQFLPSRHARRLSAFVHLLQPADAFFRYFALRELAGSALSLTRITSDILSPLLEPSARRTVLLVLTSFTAATGRSGLLGLATSWRSKIPACWYSPTSFRHSNSFHPIPRSSIHTEADGFSFSAAIGPVSSSRLPEAGASSLFRYNRGGCGVDNGCRVVSASQRAQVNTDSLREDPVRPLDLHRVVGISPSHIGSTGRSCRGYVKKGVGSRLKFSHSPSSPVPGMIIRRPSP